MHLRPESIAELQALLRECAARKERIESLDLSALNQVIEHFPEDMTATVQAGLSLAAFEKVIAAKGQWLPLDPPLPEQVTIGALLDQALSGPRRCGHGLARDYVIGMSVVLANGELVKSGGKVVKNVAGYDLAKLFIGAKGSLGIIVEATFKLRPTPEAETRLTARFTDLRQVAATREALLKSSLTPALFDLACAEEGSFLLVLGFDGTTEEVEQQKRLAEGLGFAETAPAAYWDEFWLKSAERPEKRSVLPSRTVDEVEAILAARADRAARPDLVAHLANGIIYYRNGPPAPVPEMPIKLMSRAKAVFDPDNLLPEYRP